MTCLITTQMCLKAKVNGWLGNGKRNGMIIKINLRGNEKKEWFVDHFSYRREKLPPLPMTKAQCSKEMILLTLTQ